MLLLEEPLAEELLLAEPEAEDADTTVQLGPAPVSQPAAVVVWVEDDDEPPPPVLVLLPQAATPKTTAVPAPTDNSFLGRKYLK